MPGPEQEARPGQGHSRGVRGGPYGEGLSLRTGSGSCLPENGGYTWLEGSECETEPVPGMEEGRDREELLGRGLWE